MKKIKKSINKFSILAILMIIVFACAISPKTLQNDTFYTIKIGEHILNKGIDMHDPFSWHDINYTYPHWAYDVMIYLIYSVGGQSGLYISTMVLASTLGIILYLTNAKLMKNRITSFIITMFSLFLLKDYIAARAQLFTFSLFTLTIFFIESFLETKKKKYAVGLIIIPIILANVHLAVFPFYFVLYLPYIAEYMIYILSHSRIIINTSKIENLQKKVLKIKEDEREEVISKIKELEKQNQRLIERKEKEYTNPYKIVIKRNDTVRILVIIMIICIFTGFLTPLGTTPYTYLVKTMQGNTTHNISEHLPLTLANNLNFMCALIFFIAILMFTDTKIRLKDLFMLGGLIFLTFYTRRQESMFIIGCGFILNRLICSIFNRYRPDLCPKLEKYACKTINIITITAVILIISIPRFKKELKKNYIDENSYPVAAAEWILDNLDIENIKLYNDYNYGSYLILKGIPVFIDSRADLYAPEFNGKDLDVFTDFLNISGINCDVEEKLNEYEITHIITYSNCKLEKIIKLTDNYEELYDDSKFCIYKKLEV